jgi:hypothetical protein
MPLLQSVHRTRRHPLPPARTPSTPSTTDVIISAPWLLLLHHFQGVSLSPSPSPNAGASPSSIAQALNALLLPPWAAAPWPLLVALAKQLVHVVAVQGGGRHLLGALGLQAQRLAGDIGVVVVWGAGGGEGVSTSRRWSAGQLPKQRLGPAARQRAAHMPCASILC